MTKMSNLLLELEAQKHLHRMSGEQINSIRFRIGISPIMYPFIEDNGFIYFFQNGELVCVKIEENNGVYHLWFNGRIIEFDSTTGNCFIVDFNKNFIEYFCVYDFFQTAVLKKVHYSFLYRLLIQEKVNRISGRTIRSFQVFFTPTSVITHLERAGNSILKSPDNCLSLKEMICGIKQFMMVRFRSCFMRSLNFFRNIIPNFGQTSSHLSVAGNYGVGLFLQTQFDKRFPAFGMISMLMKRLFASYPKTGTFQLRIAMTLFNSMIHTILPSICLTFTQNPIGLRKATKPIDKLLESYRLTTRLKSDGFPSSITNCVQVMSNEIQKRDEACEKRRLDEFEKQCLLEQEKQQRKESQNEFNAGIKRVKSEFNETVRNSVDLENMCNYYSDMEN